MTTISSPCRRSWRPRKDSLMIRLILFLSTASLQCFLEMASPSRATLRSLRRHRTVNHLSRLREALSKTRAKDAASSSRLVLVNRCGWLLSKIEIYLPARRPRDVTASAWRGPWRGGASRRGGLPSSPCGHENRACGRASMYWAERCVSCACALNRMVCGGPRQARPNKGRQGYVGRSLVSIEQVRKSAGRSRSCTAGGCGGAFESRIDCSVFRST